MRSDTVEGISPSRGILCRESSQLDHKLDLSSDQVERATNQLIDYLTNLAGIWTKRKCSNMTMGCPSCEVRPRDKERESERTRDIHKL